MIHRRLANLVWTTITVVAAAGCSAGADESLAATGSAVTLNTITRESLDNQGRQGNGASTTPFISSNGRYVAFQSNANVWAPTVDTNGTTDIYLKDRQTGAITLVSQANGVVGNGASFNPSVSDTGRVAFATDATNLAPNATGPFTAILVRDTDGTMFRIDVNQGQVPNGASTKPQISGDGFSVIFQSDASNLVADDTNGATDVFVGGPGATGVSRVSHPTFSSQANGPSFDGSISYDGIRVAFASDAPNLGGNNGVTHVYGQDRRGNGTTVLMSFTSTPTFTLGNGASTMPQISSDGFWISFRSLATNLVPNDTNGVADIFLGALGSGVGPTRVSVSSSGAQANGTSFQSTVATNGKAVAFVSAATNLIASDNNGFPDVFVHDQTTGQTIRMQRDASTQPDGSPLVNSSMRFSGSPSSPPFSFLAFDSQATNLVFGDTNQVADVFTASLSP
jgi:hypothetical protein